MILNYFNLIFVLILFINCGNCLDAENMSSSTLTFFQNILKVYTLTFSNRGDFQRGRGRSRQEFWFSGEPKSAFSKLCNAKRWKIVPEWPFAAFPPPLAPNWKTRNGHFLILTQAIVCLTRPYYYYYYYYYIRQFI